ncbi:MAG TPA: V-type ATP synthase subunit E [Bacillota bacterium]|nr:V-type ATP synthase subunit E [Bacillota bacterium]
MSIERLVKRLDEQVDREAEAMFESARKEMAELDAREEDRAAALVRAIRDRADREAEAGRQRVLSEGRLRARAILAQTRRAVLDEVFEAARARLAADRSPEYRERLLSALSGMAKGTGQMILSPADRQSLGPWLVAQANARSGASLQLSEETRPLLGGFVLVTGPVEINVSLDAILAERREDLEPQVARVLFGEG